jgi:alkylation response protein AidB-like acyl-CoA dehydrogenase
LLAGGGPAAELAGARREPERGKGNAVASAQTEPGPDAASTFETAQKQAADWLADNWDPQLTVRDWWARLAESGWGFPQFPAEWFGKGLSAEGVAGARTAFTDVGALGAPASLGQMLGAPMLLVHGSEEHKARFLPILVRGEEAWCQFFSEPGSGSDLASAQTRAVRDGDVWHIDGQKVWTSGAQWADRGMLLARTNREVPKHQGLSFFIIDVVQPGIEVRPLHQMNGAHGFNEVFFTDAQVDDDRMISEENGGWSVAVTVLMYERFVSALPSVLPGASNGNLDLRAGDAAQIAQQQRAQRRTGVSGVVSDVATQLGLTGDLVLRQKLAALHTKEANLGYLARAGLPGSRAGRRPSAAGSLSKLARSDLARTGRETGMAVIGAQGLLNSPDTPGGGEIQQRALSSPSASIAGGTDEIQRGIVGERVLGLPKEPRTDRDVPFRDLTIGTQRPIR